MGDTMQLWIGAGARRALAGSVVRGQPGGVCAAGVVRGANVAALCRRFEVSRKTGYKWLARHRAAADLVDRSRRPYGSPSRTPMEMEAAILALRGERPSWAGASCAGGFSILAGRRCRRLRPSPRSWRVTAADPAEAARHAPLTRFEHDRPNALWQMDFKGHFATAAGRCHPLTVLDDHSRYAVCLGLCRRDDRDGPRPFDARPFAATACRNG